MTTSHEIHQKTTNFFSLSNDGNSRAEWGKGRKSVGKIASNFSQVDFSSFLNKNGACVGVFSSLFKTEYDRKEEKKLKEKENIFSLASPLPNWKGLVFSLLSITLQNVSSNLINCSMERVLTAQRENINFP